MSNSDTAEFLAENITEHLRYIWLCHLSKDNNHPELAYINGGMEIKEQRCYCRQRCATTCFKAKYAF